tara:strand:- start:744 stop:2021 length:1278 start_codon:yes stop_codon:yes gene_type:complete
MKKLSTNNLEMLIRSDQQDLDRCERVGKADGEKNLPNQTSRSMSKFEDSEIIKLSKAIDKLVNEKDKIESKLLEEKSNMLRKLDIQIPKAQDENNIIAQNELDQIEKLAGQTSAKHAEISEKLNYAEQSLRGIRMSVNNRPLSIQLAGVYIPFMFLLAFAEVWVNSKAFELFFESSPLISLFLASAVGAMLVFFAHISGTTIKRAQSKEIIVDKPKMYIPMFILNLLVVIFIYFLAKMRQAFVAIQEQSTQGFNPEDFEKLLQDPNLSNLNIDAEQTSAIISLISTNLGEAGLFLLLVNLLVYVCGFIAAFIRHDTHPDYEYAQKQYDKHRAALTKVIKSFDDKVATIDKRKSDLHANIRKDRDMADERMYEIDKEIDEINFKVSELKSSSLDVLRSRINAYRQGNKSSRKKPEPIYFSQNVNFQ